MTKRLPDTDNVLADSSGDAPTTPAPDFIELSEGEMDALIQRVQAAIADDPALSKGDLQLILSALGSLLQLQGQIGDNRVTLHKLRKLLGLVSASEKLQSLMQNEKVSDADAGKDRKKPPPPKPPTGKKPRKTPPTVHHHALESLQKGMICPDCGRGKLYKYQPATFLRIQGHTPYSAHRHVTERLRCNACQGYQTATPSTDVLADGEVGQHYGYSARALMALNKFYMGAPYCRQNSLQTLLGEPISASSLFDQCEHVANAAKPVFDALCRETGNAELILPDDTGHNILDQQGGTQKPDRRSGVLKSRTGVYSSGILGVLPQGRQTALFETNIGHENRV